MASDRMELPTHRLFAQGKAVFQSEIGGLNKSFLTDKSLANDINDFNDKS
jgi:hypothetical protein